MKVNDVVTMLIDACILDEKKIFVYATVKNIVGGVVGSLRGLVLISVYKNVLYIHRANLDNSIGDCLASFNITDLQEISGKAGIFGGTFSFVANRVKYSFKLPSRANRFVDYFMKN